MAQVEGYREAPYQGVSQAPPQVRLPAQAELIENALVAIPDGLTPRAPFVYRGKILTANARTDGVFEYLPGQNSILSVNKESGNPKVRLFNYSSLAAQTVVVSAAAQTYLNAGTPVPGSDIGKLSVARYTFLWNRKQPVAIAAGNTASRPYEALAWVKQSAYARTFQLDVYVASSLVASNWYKTPDGSTSASAEWVDTDRVAAILLEGATGIPENGAVNNSTFKSDLEAAGFTVVRSGAVIYITHPSNDFKINAFDGQGGLACIVVKDKVQSFSDLPKVAYDGFTVRIANQSTDDADDFYVRFNETGGASSGVWEECIAPNTPVGVNPETLPVALVYSGGAWDLDTQPWTQRLVGDATLSPDPSFIGETIDDLTFWRGRLTMLYNESLLLCSSEDPFRIYPKTLAAALDTDPIELTSPYPDTSRFRYATPFDNRLVISSDKAHLYVEADGAVTAQSTKIDTLFAAELLPSIRPSHVKSRLYFAGPKGDPTRPRNFASINEVATDKTTDTTEPEDLTVVLPRYLPIDVDRHASCASQFLDVYGKSGGTELFVHLFRYDKKTDERLQNALTRWTLPSGYALGGMFFKNTILVLLLVDGAGVGHVVECDTASGGLDPDASATILTHWDMRVSQSQVTLTYNSVDDTTSAVLPYTPSANIAASVAAPGGTGGPSLSVDGPLDAFEGQRIDVVSVNAGTKTVKLSGDWRTCPLFIGEPYTMRERPSRIYIQDDNGRPIRSGRLTVQRILFDVADTGYLRVEVKAAGRPTRSYEFNGYRWDDPASVPDTAAKAETVFTVPIHCDASTLVLDIINDSHLTCKMVGFNWFGKFNPKARRVT